MKQIVPLSLIATVFLAFSGFSSDEPTDDQLAFFERMMSFCGESFPGSIPEGQPTRGFTDEMVAHFGPCSDDEIRIPFHVGEDESRTWILTLEEDGLLFKHDHRYPDGTPEEMTNYGGWADESGSQFGQAFPADEETIALRDNLRSHIWKFTFDEDENVLSYSLYLYENHYFTAEFDLTAPLAD